MTLEQYIQQKNLDISIVNLQDLENHNRFDAEFYAVDILGLRKNLKNNGAKKLVDYKVNINRGVNPNYSIDGEIKVLRPVNIRENGFSDTRQDYVSIDSYNSIRNGKVKKQDILLNVTGVGTLGRSSFVFDEEKYIYSQDIVALRKINDILPEFLFVYLNSNIGQKQINTLYKGSSGQIHLYPDDIEEILVPVVSFQDKIANLVQESYKQKELSKKLYLEAEKLLLSELGLDDYKPTEENISIKDSEEVELFGRVDAEFFQPKYDEITYKIQSYKGGYDFLRNLFKQNKESNRLEAEKINYIEIGDINISNGEIIHNEIEKNNLPANAKILLKKDDLLVSTVRPYRGAIAIVRNEIENLVGSGAFTVLREKTSYKKETLQILLKLNIYKELMLRYNCGASYPVIKDEDVLNLPIPKVDIKVQEEIAKLVKESHKSLDLSKQLLEKAKKSVEIFIEEDEEIAGEFLES